MGFRKRKNPGADATFKQLQEEWARTEEERKLLMKLRSVYIKDR